MEKQQFDFEAFKKDAIEKLKQGKRINGGEGIFQPMLKHFLESALEAESIYHRTQIIHLCLFFKGIHESLR